MVKDSISEDLEFECLIPGYFNIVSSGAEEAMFKWDKKDKRRRRFFKFLGELPRPKGLARRVDIVIQRILCGADGIRIEFDGEIALTWVLAEWDAVWCIPEDDGFRIYIRSTPTPADHLSFSVSEQTGNLFKLFNNSGKLLSKYWCDRVTSYYAFRESFANEQ